MRRAAWAAVGLGVGVVALVPGRAAPPGVHGYTPDEVERILLHSPLPAAPPDPTNAWADDPGAAHLGRFLFFDPRLSGPGDVSCATCHDPSLGFGDGLPLTAGVSRGDRHAQSLWNVAHNRWFLWDGRRGTLWSQAIEAIERDGEMGGHRLEVARLVMGDAELRRAYEGVFGPAPAALDRLGSVEALGPEAAWAELDGAARDASTRVIVNVGKAIAAYERRLISTDAPFDRFAEGLRAGDVDLLGSIDAAAQRGLGLFVGEAGCAACHAGPNFSDGSFHNTLVDARLDAPDRARVRDDGRRSGVRDLLAGEFRADGAYSDDPGSEAGARLAFVRTGPDLWGAFKTPTLRSAAQSPPYTHAGRLATLRDVIDHYSELEVGAAAGHHARDPLLRPLGLTEAEKSDIEAFLRTLTGAPLDPALLRAPSSPVYEPPGS